MPVTPTPESIRIDLPEEYLEFLEMACESSGRSPQEIVRAALAMLRAGDQSLEEVLTEVHSVGGEQRADLRKAYLAAWDRWGERSGQDMPVGDGLAAFVEEQVAQGAARDATGVVMLALLTYAKVMEMGFVDEEEEDSQ